MTHDPDLYLEAEPGPFYRPVKQRVRRNSFVGAIRGAFWVFVFSAPFWLLAGVALVIWGKK